MRKKDNNTISVVVPVYNVKEYIEDCMQSVLGQSYEDLDIILVDDGSTDGSGLICDEYAKQDNRVSVIHQSNRGVSFARNEGLQHAKGSYVAFLDSDDIILRTYFEVLKSCIDQTGADIAKCDIDRFVSISDASQINSPIKKVRVKEPKQDLIDILYCKGSGKWSGPGAKLYRASLLKGLKFNTSMAYEEDFDFLCLAVKKAQKISTVEYRGYMYRERPGSAMQSGFKPLMLESIEKRLASIEVDDDIARAQRANIALNAIHRFSLIPSTTKKFKTERDRLWQIILDLRLSAACDPLQRIDHKASTFASYLGRHLLGRIIRVAKRIKLEEI